MRRIRNGATASFWRWPIVTALLFFVSLLVHELAHSVFAKSHGLPVKEITLFALGGVSQIEKEPTSAKTEFWMAFAGPLTSAGHRRRSACGAESAAEPAAGMRWSRGSAISISRWPVFNMIPGYPLDGGRILRAIIWWKTGDVNAATRRAAKTGQGVAISVYRVGHPAVRVGRRVWRALDLIHRLVPVAGFDRELRGKSACKHAFEGVTAGDLMSDDCPSLDGNLDVQHFVDEELLRTGKRCFLVLQKGEVAGLITPHEVKAIERARWPYTTLSDVMRPLEDLHTVPPETPLKDVLEIMGREDLNQVPVMANGHLAGILSRAHVLDYLRTRAELKA